MLTFPTARRWFAGVAVAFTWGCLVAVGPAWAQAGAASDSQDEPAKPKTKLRAAKKPKAEKPSDEPGKDDADDKAKSGENPKADEDFGAGRKKSKSKEPAAKLSKEERAAQKFKKAVANKLGRKDEGLFIIETREETIEWVALGGGPPRPNRTVKADFLLFQGKDEAVDFIVEFMSEGGDGPDDAKRAAKGAARPDRNRRELPGFGGGRETATPEPQVRRDWAMRGRFDTDESEKANAFLERLKKQAELAEERARRQEALRSGRG